MFRKHAQAKRKEVNVIPAREVCVNITGSETHVTQAPSYRLDALFGVAAVMFNAGVALFFVVANETNSVLQRCLDKGNTRIVTCGGNTQQVNLLVSLQLFLH